MKYAESNQEVGGLKMVLPRIHGNAMGIHPVNGSSLMGMLDGMIWHVVTPGASVVRTSRLPQGLSKGACLGARARGDIHGAMVVITLN
jgi:hypothetical protein